MNITELDNRIHKLESAVCSIRLDLANLVEHTIPQPQGINAKTLGLSIQKALVSIEDALNKHLYYYEYEKIVNDLATIKQIATQLIGE